MQIISEIGLQREKKTKFVIFLETAPTVQSLLFGDTAIKSQNGSNSGAELLVEE